MVTKSCRPSGAARWLHDDEIHPHGQARQGRAVRQSGQHEQAANRRTDVAALAVVEGLLGESELARPAPANLHDHEFCRRPAIDRDEVQLGSADADVAGEDQPTRLAQSIRHQPLSGIAGPLLRGSCPRRIGMRHPTSIVPRA